MEGRREKEEGKRKEGVKKEKERERWKQEKRGNCITNSFLENDLKNFISHNNFEMCWRRRQLPLNKYNFRKISSIGQRGPKRNELEAVLAQNPSKLLI